MVDSGFGQLGIDPIYVQRLEELEITEPSPIQAEAIPVALQKKDIVAQSQTGTGKTLAYVLPILHHIEPTLREVQAMVLVPTRELGMQIVHTLEQLTEGTDIRVQQLIGGASIERQIDKLRTKPHIVVGTPGRVQELAAMRKLKLTGIRTLVVDEVDQVFELGSMKEVVALLKGMLRDRQMLFFSATFPPQTQAVIDTWMNEPEYVRVNPSQRTAETLEHLYVMCEERDKIDTLRRLVRLENPKAAIVFINDTDDIGEAVHKLKYAGLSAEGLYGDSFKQERAKAMQAFRAGRFQLLVATDIAARGLDLPQVTHVFNLDPPIDADHYVHRVGRTGRMGRRGLAISIITHKQKFIMEKFEKALDIVIQRKILSHGKLFDPRENSRLAAGAEAGNARKLVKVQPARQEQNGSGTDAQVDAETGGERRSNGLPGGHSVRQQPSGAQGTSGRAAKSNGNAAKSGQASGGKQSQGGGKKAAQPPAPSNRALEREKERDRKNKGAPKWLKAKPDRTTPNK
ncbi:DEAD/DEAH box helicase [Paenibacillus sp. YYML68]|uniref:DEAD/DEAH box helicase n=1 Tax=Paenibacillus sp. YYML68 TaxID=2909250 RepID=UPI002490424B|nr:DEAD/DEAH box helicase [Paenibacillus sp. YYML68]